MGVNRSYWQRIFLFMLIYTVSTSMYAAGPSISLTITVNGQLIVPGPNKTVQVCKGAPYNLLMGNSVTPAPAGPIYQWINLDSMVTVNGQPQINTPNAGRWVAILKYYNSSTATFTSATDTVNLVYASPTPFNVTTATGAPLANGSNINICGSIDSTFLASPGFTDYKWYKNSTSNLVSSSNVLTFTPAVIASGENIVPFFVTAKNAFGCDVSAQQNVRRDNSVFVDLGPDIAACTGTTVTLSSPASSTIPFVITYKWSTGAITYTIPVNTAGKYKLTISNGSSKCKNTDSVNVSFLTGPAVTVSKDTTICNNTSVQLNAQASGSGVFSYSWAPATGLSNSSISNPIAAPTAVGTTTYTVTVNGTSGCGGGTSVSTDITMLPPFSNTYGTLTAGTDTTVCFNSTAQLSPSISSPYAASYTWLWSPGDGLNNTTLKNPTANITTAGMQKYIVAATDDRGCTFKDSVTITNLSELTTTTNFIDSTICAGSPIVLKAFGSGGSLTKYAYTFTPATGIISGNELTLSPMDTIYSILVSTTDSLGCASTTVNVTINGYRPYIHIADAADTIGYGGNPLVIVADIHENPNVTVDWYEVFTSTYLSSGLTFTSTIDEYIYAFATDSYYTCTNTDSVNIKHLDADLHALFIPNIFSPKAANPQNQQLKVYGTSIQEDAFSFRIYNQWGQLVYQTNSFTEANTIGWAGEFKSNDGAQSSNVYTYTLEGKFFDGLPFNKAGTATMLR